MLPQKKRTQGRHRRDAEADAAGIAVAVSSTAAVLGLLSGTVAHPAAVGSAHVAVARTPAAAAADNTALAAVDDTAPAVVADNYLAAAAVDTAPAVAVDIVPVAAVGHSTSVVAELGSTPAPATTLGCSGIGVAAFVDTRGTTKMDLRQKADAIEVADTAVAVAGHIRIAAPRTAADSEEHHGGIHFRPWTQTLMK